MKTDSNIGKIYGCYEILGVGTPSVLPSGQRKKNYICKCINCNNIRQLNAYKVTHNNYQYCNNCRPHQRDVKIQMIGRRFGTLTVVQRIDNHIQPNGQTKVMYKCICDCGNEVSVSASHLLSGHTTSCGCLRVKTLQELLVKDLSGQQFGKLTVVDKNEIKNGRQYWNCICECGRSAIVSSASLTTGRRKSCGCLSSIAEYEFAAYLDEKKYKYEPQFKFNDCKDKRPLPFDFGIKDEHNNIIMLVELHGQQHYYPFTYCNESKDRKFQNYIDRQRKDSIKENYCKKNNIPLLIIKYNNFDKKEQIFEEFYNTLFNKGGITYMSNFNSKEIKNDVIRWIRNWFNENGPDCNAVIGISGGKDSTVIAALCTEALGKNRVIGVKMPCGNQSDIDDSNKVIDFLGIKSFEVNIKDSVDGIVNQLKENNITVTEQAICNLPARIRMSTLFAVAQCCNGRVSCNCNLSEDYVGYSTFGGDDFGSFAPLRNFTTDEVVAIGDACGLPYELTHKVPSDGLCGKTDEDNLGFTYEVLNKYIRTGVCEDKAVKTRIDEMHQKNLFKLQMMPSFPYKEEK